MQKKQNPIVSITMNIIHSLKHKLGIKRSLGPGSADILAAIGREMTARQYIFLHAIQVPDLYRVDLSSFDYKAIKPVLELFCQELQEEAYQLVRRKKFHTAENRITVEILCNPNLNTGEIRVKGSFSPGSTSATGNESSEKKKTTVQLIIAAGSSHEETRQLDPGTYLIGRGRDADIFPLVEDELMSRNHCLLTISEKEIILQDLDSGNGLFINDNERVANTRLEVGSSFLLGNTKFILQP